MSGGPIIHRSRDSPVPTFPTDLDYYSFFFEYWPPERPDIRRSGVPLLIDEETGSSWTFEDIQARTDALSVGLSRTLPLQAEDTVCIFAPNSVEYLPILLAVHRLGGVVTPSNPNLGVGELVHQLQASRANAVFVSELKPARSVGLEAAALAGVALERVVVVQTPATIRGQAGSTGKVGGRWTVEALVSRGRELIQTEGTAVLNTTRHQLEGENRLRTALISFSSGTSGLPKGVRISHLNPIANILQHVAHLRIPATIYSDPGADAKSESGSDLEPVFAPGRDRVLGMLPMFHIFGLVVVLSTFVWAGVGVVVVPRFGGTGALLSTTVRYRVTHWFLVPPVLVKLVKETSAVAPLLDRLGHVKVALSGAAPLKDALALAFEARFRGVRLMQGYGMTETCATVVMSSVEEPYVLGSAGRVVVGTEARVVVSDGGERGRDARRGEPGELWVRGPQVTMGYLNDETATRQSFLDDGWFRTGDEVIIDGDGLVFVVDRLKEMIKVKGYQVAPAELEGVLLDSRDVLDAGVVGFADEASGELPLAFVSLSPEARARVDAAAARAGGDGDGRALEEEELGRIVVRLLEMVRAKKVRYKHLVGVIIVPEVPKNPSGKILRKELKKLVPVELSPLARGVARARGRL